MKRSIEEYEAMAKAAMADEAPDFRPTGPAEIRKGRGRGTGKSPTITVRFTSETRDLLIEQAKREEISVSDLVRKASDEYLRTH